VAAVLFQMMSGEGASQAYGVELEMPRQLRILCYRNRAGKNVFGSFANIRIWPEGAIRP
jgi:hypothetical protein